MERFRMCKICRKQRNSLELVERVCIKCRISVSKDELTDNSIQKEGSIETIVETKLSPRKVHFDQIETQKCTNCIDNSVALDKINQRLDRLEDMIMGYIDTSANRMDRLEGLAIGIMELIGQLNINAELSRSQ